MKNIKKFESYIDEYQLNENFFKRQWDKVYTYFKEKFKDGWLYYMLFMKKMGKSPKGFDIIVPPSYNLKPIPNPKDVQSEVEGGNIEDNVQVQEVQPIEEFLNHNSISFSNSLMEAEISLDSKDPNMPNVDVPTLMEEIHAVWDMNEDRIESGEPRTDNNALFIWGAHGIGKTSILKQVAKELDAVVCVWLLSQSMPEDIKGVPKIDNIGTTNSPDDERTVFKLPEDFPPSTSESRGVIFFDEMNQANKATLGAAMTLCLDGSIGKYKLPEHWIVIAAGNRKEDVGRGGQTVPLSKPLADRFAHVNYAPKFQNWLDHMMDNQYMNPDVLAFLEFDKEWWFKVNDTESNFSATPRSWEKASRDDYVRRKKNWHTKLSYDKIRLIYGKKLGYACADAFIEFLKMRDLYSEADIKEVYEKGKDAKIPNVRLDQQFIINSAIAYYKRGEKITMKDLKNVYEFGLSLPNSEDCTSLLSMFNQANKKAIESDEELVEARWDYIEKWTDRLEDVAKELED